MKALEDWKYIMLPKGPYPFGVEAGHKEGDLVELHGGFTTKEAAEKYAAEMRETFSDYAYIKIVKIETPRA